MQTYGQMAGVQGLFFGYFLLAPQKKVTRPPGRTPGISLTQKPLPRGFIAFGEVGLAGEVRPAPRGQERLREAAKLGFSVAVVPKANAPRKAVEGLTIHAVERIEQAIDVVRGLSGG